ncbi:MAG: DUF3822 family protein [Saprospiraceae bacterium]|nr:DUF3822 family protein [Saprospiraceae bacterium]
MGKIKNQIIEDSYSKKDSTDQELSILIGVDSFAYIVVDSENRQPLLIRNFELGSISSISKMITRIQQIIQEDKPLNLAYKRIRIAYAGSASTLIPQRLFNPSEKEEYLSQLTAMGSTYEFRSDHLLPMDAQNVYAIEEELATFMRLSYPGTMMLHLNTVIYSQIVAIARNIVGSFIFANVRGRNLNVFYFDKGDLVFMNSFEFLASKDFIYYIMLIFNQFNLDSQKVPLHLSGEILKESEVYLLLYRYIKFIHFLSKDQLPFLGPKLSNVSAYQHFDLIALGNMK